MTDMKNEIIVCSGMSSAGKDTISQMLKDRNGYNFVVSHTTRPMRDGESEGNPYYFVSKEEFDLIAMIEHRAYNTLVNNIPDTWHYGVSTLAIDDDKPYVVVLDFDGYIDFIQHFGERVIGVYIDVDEQTRKQRCISRGDFDPHEWNRREQSDAIAFEGFDKVYSATFKGYDSEELYNNIINFVEKRCGNEKA